MGLFFLFFGLTKVQTRKEAFMDECTCCCYCEHCYWDNTDMDWYCELDGFRVGLELEACADFEEV